MHLSRIVKFNFENQIYDMRPSTVAVITFNPFLVFGYLVFSECIIWEHWLEMG